MRKFSEIYNEVIKDKNYLEKVNNQYKMSLIKKFFWFLLILFAIVLIMCIVGKFQVKDLFRDPAYLMVFFVALITIVGCYLYSYVCLRDSFRLKYKETVIKKIVNSIDSNLIYSPTQGIGLMDYHRGFRDKGKRIETEDMICGRIDDSIILNMSQVKVTHEESHRDRDGRYVSETVVDFFGLYGFARIQDIAQTEVNIVSNSFFRKFNQNRVEVESEHFEKIYDVISANRMYAMKIMRPKVIEAFVKVSESGCKGLEVRIFNDTIFFRYKAGDIFEPAKIGDMFKPEKIREYIMTIYNPLNIVRALNYAIREEKKI